MKILKAYLYFYWDMLILVGAVLQLTIFTISVLVFVLFAGIVLNIIKRFKWQTEIDRFEDEVASYYVKVGSDVIDWADGFKKIIK